MRISDWSSDVCSSDLWMATSADELRRVPALLHAAAERHGADLLHLNLPSQAAGCPADLPRIVVSHSCVHTWWRSVHGNAAPREWAWQWQANRDGFDAAGVRSEEHTSELPSLMRNSYAVFRLKKKI